MRGRKTELKVRMDEETREILQGWLRKQKIEAGLAKRAWAMLLLADGEAFIHVAKQVGLAERHVRKWAERFIKKGIAGLYDKPRPGRKPVFSP
jgi:transposase